MQSFPAGISLSELEVVLVFPQHVLYSKTHRKSHRTQLIHNTINSSRKVCIKSFFLLFLSIFIGYILFFFLFLQPLFSLLVSTWFHKLSSCIQFVYVSSFLFLKHKLELFIESYSRVLAFCFYLCKLSKSPEQVANQPKQTNLYTHTTKRKKKRKFK